LGHPDITVRAFVNPTAVIRQLVFIVFELGGEIAL
jgi:hypothetical protein